MTLARHRLIILAALLCAVLAVPHAHAAEFGVRAYGMGGAYTAVSTDLAALVHNPSRLVDTAFEVGIGLGTDDLDSVTSFHKLLSDPHSFDEDFGLSIISLSGISIGRFGAGLAVDGDLHVSTDCDGGEDLCAEGRYMSQWIFGLGHKASGFPLNLGGVKLGAAVKRFDGREMAYTRTYTGGPTDFDAVTVDRRGEGYGLNLGATIGNSDIITLGLSASDLFASVTWTGTETTEEFIGDVKQSSSETKLPSKKDTIKPTYRAGLAVKPPLLGAVLAADISSDGVVRYGVEKNLFLNLFSVRAGQIHEDGKTTTTAGLGVNLGPARLDVAVGSSDGFDTYTTLVEGSVRF